jgi:hypothetical protein
MNTPEREREGDPAVLKITTHYRPDRVVYRLFKDGKLLGVYETHWEAVEAKVAAMDDRGVAL